MPVIDLPYAYGKPLMRGVLRTEAADFMVEEQLAFEPSGEGEHHFLWIEKAGLNTEQVARRIAQIAQLPIRQISYCGMKDRHALTRQWFSVHLPGKKTIDWSQLNSPALSLLAATLHRKKLRRGTHRGNRFTLRVRDWLGDHDDFIARVEKIQLQGVPNYFGEQRFGHDGANLDNARRWFAGELKPGRHLRGIYLSAVRGWLFNQVLAQRVSDGSWQQLLPGELVALQGSHSVFAHNEDDALQQRLLAGDVHPTGPLYGKNGTLVCEKAVAALETSILKPHSELLAGLEQAGLKAERRPLRMIPHNLLWKTVPEQTVEITFSLPTGCFATVLMRELLDYRVADTERVVDRKQ